MNAHVWWVHDNGQRSLDALAAQLPANEQATLGVLKMTERQRHFILSRHLLRSLIADTCNISYAAAQFRRADSGRLLLDSPEGWHISISHCHQHVAVMLAAQPCGVDIEVARTVRFQALANRYFSEIEKNYLTTFSDTEKALPFFRLWTLKEASVKALGVGLANHLADLSFDVSKEVPVQLAGEPLQLWQQVSESFFLAATVRGRQAVSWQIRESKAN